MDSAYERGELDDGDAPSGAHRAEPRIAYRLFWMDSA